MLWLKSMKRKKVRTKRLQPKFARKEKVMKEVRQRRLRRRRKRLQRHLELKAQRQLLEKTSQSAKSLREWESLQIHLSKAVS